MKKEILDLLKKYCTARVDIKNVGSFDNQILILKNSDLKSNVYQPTWLQTDDGTGTIIESETGTLDLKIKCIHDGVLQIIFRCLDYRDANNNRFPIYLDYTNITINNKKIYEKNQVITFDKAKLFKKKVRNNEIINIHLEWLPFNRNDEYNPTDLSLIEKVTFRENQLKSIPRLSCTSLGKSVLDGKLIFRNWLAFTPGSSVLDDYDFFENHWFTRYLKHKFPDDEYKIGIFGVSNAHDNLTYPMEEKKILYSTEDLNYRYLELKLHYDKYALDYVDLAIGFDLVDNRKYIRFPYWIMDHFSPNVTDEDIEKIVEIWNSSTYEKSDNVASISSHDIWGVRSIVANDIEPIVDIKYAGKWKNNTTELWDKFKNSKRDFLKQFKFNLCAENIISDGYVTEKIFDAFRCDCIPLYSGGGNYFEPKVINPKSVIRWEGDDKNLTVDTDMKRQAYYGHQVHSKGKWIAKENCNSDSVELFKNLLTDEKTYKDFKDQDRVLDSSTKFIINKFSELEKQFERLIYS